MKGFFKLYGHYVIGGAIGLALIIWFVAPLRKAISAFFSIGQDDRQDESENRLEDALDRVKVEQSKLQFDPTFYKSWANKMYYNMRSFSPYFTRKFTDQDFFELEALNVDDLKQIAKEFGVKDKSNWMGLHKQLTGSLFEWFDSDLAGAELSRMKKLWAKTGLWGNSL